MLGRCWLLQDYVLDELIVKKLTLSTDKQQYGVNLRAEPDHTRPWGRASWGPSRTSPKRSRLNDAQVSEFIKTNRIEVLGSTSLARMTCAMYSFEGSSDSKYEAHSDNDILVLLDCTPDQSMLDEGIARDSQPRPTTPEEGQLAAERRGDRPVHGGAVDHSLAKVILTFQSPSRPPPRIH